MGKSKSNEVRIADEVIRTENKYLTKLVVAAVAALIATLGVIGKWQVDATEANKDAIDALTKSVIESNTTNNNRFNQINNRLDMNQVNGKAIVDSLKREDQRIWEAIEDLKR